MERHPCPPTRSWPTDQGGSALSTLLCLRCLEREEQLRSVRADLPSNESVCLPFSLAAVMQIMVEKVTFDLTLDVTFPS